MQVEEVGRHGALHEVLQVAPRGVPVLQSREHVDEPGPAPARPAAAVGEALLDRHACRVSQLAITLDVEPVARVQGVEVAHVAVPRLGLQVGAVPLLDAPVLHQHEAGREPRTLVAHLDEEGIVLAAEHLGRFEHVVQQLRDELLVHGGSHRRGGARPVRQAIGVLGAG